MARLIRNTNAIRGKTLKRKNPKTLKKLAIAFAIVIIAVGLYVQFLSPYTLEAKQRVQLESTQSQLIETENRLLETEAQSKEQYDAQVKELEEVQKKLEETEKQLQAKRSVQKALAAEPKKTIKKPTVAYTGNKETWLKASGIPESSWWAVDSIVSGESGWNPSAYNTSSGACGLGQQLPCGKWGGDWRDPVHALKSMDGYVQAYGGWAAAVEFRNCTGYCYSARAGKVVYKDHTWY